MRHETRQLGLAEALVSGGKGGARLERIAGLSDWAAREVVLGWLRSTPTGWPFALTAVAYHLLRLPKLLATAA